MNSSRYLRSAIICGLCLSLVVCTSHAEEQVSLETRLEITPELFDIKRDYGVTVHYRYNQEKHAFFNLTARKHFTTVEQISETELKRAIPLLSQFLSRYPKRVIERNLSDIFLLGRLTSGGFEYGGTRTRSSIYLVCPKDVTVTDHMTLSTLHHELSSVFMWKHDFPRDRWISINPKDFVYTSAPRQMPQASWRTSSEEIREAGFIVDYATSCVENDFNSVAQWMFTQSEQLATICKEHERIREKVLLALDFYESIDPAIKFEFDRDDLSDD